MIRQLLLHRIPQGRVDDGSMFALAELSLSETTSCRSYGRTEQWRVQRDVVRLAELRISDWVFRFWTRMR
jgi:hypothetical protein